MMDMVERVARAMAAKEGWRWDDDRQMLDCAAAGLQNTSRERDTWRKRAITALEALREPTEEQLRAAWDKVDYNIDDFWRAMIDSILKRGTT